MELGKEIKRICLKKNNKLFLLSLQVTNVHYECVLFSEIVHN